MRRVYRVTALLLAGCASATALALDGAYISASAAFEKFAAATRYADFAVNGPAPEPLSIGQYRAEPEPPTHLQLSAFPDGAPGNRVSGDPLEPSYVNWSRQIEPGDTLDAVLVEAGLSSQARAEVVLALGSEFDLRRLRPGYELVIQSRPDGTPWRVSLIIEDGTRIEAMFSDTLKTSIIKPDPEIVLLAGETQVESSIFTALDKAGLPERFAVDLAQVLGGTIDFRRDLSGGESLRLLWREARVQGSLIGQPEIAFAALQLGDALYEIVWPNDQSGNATIYLDGELIRVFAQPVEGARLSSVFGSRIHPVYGKVRMHTGVDLSASSGTPVRATGPGRIAFIGWRKGYGRVVEIAHGAEVLTRYAHLSSVPKTLSLGRHVATGDMIGRIGSTGTVTGPNLHYEVIVNGNPTDPLSEDWLSKISEPEAERNLAADRLRKIRALINERLSGGEQSDPSANL